MNRVLRFVPGIKDTTVKRYHYDSRADLKSLLNDFICKQSTIEPEQFIFDPIFQMPGLNTSPSCFITAFPEFSLIAKGHSRLDSTLALLRIIQ